MPRAKPGDVWLVDLGLAAKVRHYVVASLSFSVSMDMN